MLQINNWCWIQTTATREDVGRVRRRDAIEALVVGRNRQLDKQQPEPWRGRSKGESPWKGLARFLGPGIGPLRVRGAGTAAGR